MANTHSTLTELFGDIADSIRSKAGTSAPIVADAFPEAIEAIPSGGGDIDALIDGTISEITANASAIKEYLFMFCNNLISATFPFCEEIKQYAFCECKNLTTISFPLCEKIGTLAFMSCYKLKRADFAECLSLGMSAFKECSSISAISLPLCNSIPDSTFYGCLGLSEIELPSCSFVGREAFRICSHITKASLPKCEIIGINAFSSCYMLSEVTIGTGISTVCNLSASTAFYRCSALTSIYVPASLLTDYQNATNWTYFSSKMVGI